MGICGQSGKALRKLFFAFLILLLLILISIHMIERTYFKKTFSRQVAGTVLRCSKGILTKVRGGDWAPLNPGDHLQGGQAIAMPPSCKSVVAFDGLRLLTEEPAEVEISGIRDLVLRQGSVAIAVADRDDSAIISVSRGTVETNDSVIRMSRADHSAVVDCISGTALLKTDDQAKHRLRAGERATIDDEMVETTVANMSDPFAVARVAVIDRIRDRFERVLSRYARNPKNYRGQALFGSTIFERATEWDGRGWQFASYISGESPNIVRGTESRSIADYYETIFAPSNRSISIGKQELVPLEADMGAGFPTWSHDGSMIAFVEATSSWPARVRVVRLNDFEDSWYVSQEYNTVLPFFPITWAPDGKHVLFMVADHMEFDKWGLAWWWAGPYHIKIAPIDPSEGPVRDFDSPFRDLTMPLPLPVGNTIAPQIMKLPWGDALLCVNWGNLAYVPVEEDGQSVPGVPGLFLTDFNPYRFFVMGGYWSPSGSMILFTAAKNLDFDNLNTYILYDVEDILDGFTDPPRSPDDPRLKQVAPSKNPQLPGNFSFDESLVFFQEDVNDAWRAIDPTRMVGCNFDLFYADARRDQPSRYTQIHLPGNQLFMQLSPESNRLVFAHFQIPRYRLKVVSFDIEADLDMDLGGVLIDNSGSNLIVPPGTLEQNFKVKISTPFTIGAEAEIPEGETQLFALRLLDAEGLENPKFVEPVTLTIRYTDDEVAGLDEGMLEIYYYDESEPDQPVWVPLGGTVDPEYNEITVEIQHFSKFSAGGRICGKDETGE